MLMTTYIEKWNLIGHDLVKWKSGHLNSCYGTAYADLSIQAILDYVGDYQGLRILDLGCGDGLLGHHFADKASVVGLDASSVLVGIGKDKYPDIAFHLGDITKQLPYISSSFDVVVSNMVFMSIPNIELVFLETFRVLKENGRFIFSIIHPCFYGKRWYLIESNLISIEFDMEYTKEYAFEKLLDSDFQETITTFHRPIQKYVEIFLKTGFTLTGFLERNIPCINSSLGGFSPKEIKNHLVPNTLIIHGYKRTKAL